MPNDNPQVVKFANEVIRPMADWYHSLVDSSDEMISKFNNEGIAALVPNDGDVIVDGSPADGRGPLTNQQLLIFIDICTVFRNAAHANSNLIYNQVDAVSVNPREVV